VRRGGEIPRKLPNDRSNSQSGGGSVFRSEGLKKVVTGLSGEGVNCTPPSYVRWAEVSLSQESVSARSGKRLTPFPGLACAMVMTVVCGLPTMALGFRPGYTSISMQ